MRDARTRLIVAALPEPGATLRLSRDETAHARARRLVPGDSVVLLDGSGREGLATLVRLSRTEGLVRVSEISPPERSEPPISLLVAGLRAERLAWLVEKATELGASRVVVIESDRTQSFRASPRTVPRLENVARAAAKQCGRADWPELSGPIGVTRALEESESVHRFFLDFDGDRFPRRLSAASAALVIGPEGGWADAERRSASNHGWKTVSLPAGTLRAETAAIAALTLLRAAMES